MRDAERQVASVQLIEVVHAQDHRKEGHQRALQRHDGHNLPLGPRLRRPIRLLLVTKILLPLRVTPQPHHPLGDDSRRLRGNQLLAVLVPPGPDQDPSAGGGQRVQGAQGPAGWWVL